MDRRLVFTAIVPALVAVAWAQQPAVPTPESEAALRARAQQFYQLELEKKFRQAEAFVAEDTKDYYFNNGKPDIKNFRIDQIEFSPDGTKAKLIVNITSMMAAPAMGAMEFSASVPMTWKLDNGEWCWYKVAETEIDTPFGKWKVGDGGSGSPPPMPAGMPDPSKLKTAVSIDRTSIDLTAGSQKVETVTITNHLPAPIDLVPGPDGPKGLIMAIDKKKLAPEEKAVISFSTSGTEKPIGTVRISAGPVQDFVIQIRTK